MDKQAVIPAIHNYCDRWCERCYFADRCAVGLAEQKQNASGKERDWVAELHETFHHMASTLDDTLRKFGLDPAEIRNQPLPETNLKIEEIQEKVRRKHRHYLQLANAFFKRNERFFEGKSLENEQLLSLGLGLPIDEMMLFGESISTIHWFAIFIGAKASRAIGGLEDMGDWGGDPLQSDANGSAKVCQIAISQSISAWEIVRRNCPEKTDEILDLLKQLLEIQRDMNALFPDWEKFHRPGFDDEPSFAVFGKN